MKNYTLIILSALLLMGCSTYTVKDYPSKDKFYEDFNYSVKNRTVNITLMNDSSFTINDGIMLKNNKIYSLDGKNNRSYALSNIKEIKYSNNDSVSASILLYNGELLRGRNIRTDSDSIHFTVTTSKTYNNFVPVQLDLVKVKTVSYKIRWRSSVIGILSGAITGLITAIIVSNSFTNSKDDNGKAEEYFLIAPPIGALFGGIVGGIIGWNTIYQFNP